jgi:DNA invertase Pin-like site-specific DNA recombinase
VTVVDIYVRQSGDETEASPELQEAACRVYAASQGWEVEDVVTEANTSSILPVDERGLGYLVQRCEAGLSAGIICRHLDRFGRSVGEGALAYKRIVDAGARLVAVADGLDSSRDGAKLQFTMLMAFAEQVYDRNRGWFITGKERAAARGEYGAPPPFGYRRKDVAEPERDGDGDGKVKRDARLVAHPEEADTVREIFRLRADGLGFSEIARRLDGALTRSGVRRVVMNRAYLGEQRIPNPARRGEPKVIKNSHVPLVTEREWEAANAVKGQAPRHTGLGEKTQLKGVVRCGVCSNVMHVLSYGKDRSRRTYACTACGKTSMSVSKVEPAVFWQLQLGIGNREPHIAAVIEGDTRYTDALVAVEEVQRVLEEYRDNLELQKVLGMADYTEGLRQRKAAVETARRALREVPRPAPADGRKLTLEEADLTLRRDFYRRAIAEVFVFPRSAGERLRMRWAGAEEAFTVPPAPKPVDLAALVAQPV